jgi:hypothetical protein
VLWRILIDWPARCITVLVTIGSVFLLAFCLVVFILTVLTLLLAQLGIRWGW